MLYPRLYKALMLTKSKSKRSINKVQNPIGRTFVIKLFTYTSNFLIILQFGKVKIIIETVQ